MSSTQFRPTYVSFDRHRALINGCKTVASLDDVNAMLGI